MTEPQSAQSPQGGGPRDVRRQDVDGDKLELRAVGRCDGNAVGSPVDQSRATCPRAEGLNQRAGDNERGEKRSEAIRFLVDQALQGGKKRR